MDLLTNSAHDSTNSAHDSLGVSLLGGFECVHAGSRVTLPLGAQRLLALLALQRGGVHRTYAAERLWPDSSVSRSAGNLRSAIWRGRQIAGTIVIECAGPRLRMAASVRVDLDVAQRRAQQILESTVPVHSIDCEAVVATLSRELLPDWTEEWLILERERWAQIRLYALEGLAQKLRSGEQYLGALKTALAAVAIEPIREAPHRIIVEVHIAEGNVASALRHYQRYRALLQRELGVVPSPRMAELASALLPS